MTRAQVAALVTGVAIVFGGFGFRRSWVELDARVAGSRQWESGAWVWGFHSPKVEALAALLEKVRATIPARSVVLLEGGRFSDDGEFLVHWTQFLAPELDIVLRTDLPAGVLPEFVLELGPDAKGAAPGEVLVREPIGRLSRAR